MAHSASSVKGPRTASIPRRSYVTHKRGKRQTGPNTRVTRSPRFTVQKRAHATNRPSVTCRRLERPLGTTTMVKVAHRQCPVIVHVPFRGNGRLWLQRGIAEQPIPDSGPVQLVADAPMAPSQLAVTKDGQQKVNTTSNSKCNSVLLQL